MLQALGKISQISVDTKMAVKKKFNLGLHTGTAGKLGVLLNAHEQKQCAE